ncbi:unnamed protein product [Phytomonas sp. Hart1]|nr:unnamed protein product [Phytomonas sp. Hart1]|eukprot:CCW68729.1 unnamed protein product [Phytomonas sp. isolate Hart1]
MLAALYYRQKGSQPNEEKEELSARNSELEDHASVEKNSKSEDNLVKSVDSGKSSRSKHIPSSCSRTQTPNNSCYEKTEYTNNPFIMDGALQMNYHPENIIHTTKLLRFSNKKSLENSNRIRNELDEAIGGKYISCPSVNDEFLHAKRLAFLETLFNGNNAVQIPPRFDIEKSRESLCTGVTGMFGGNYSDAIRELQTVWNRLK